MGGCASSESIVSSAEVLQTPSNFEEVLNAESGDKSITFSSNSEREHVLSIAVADQVSVCEDHKTEDDTELCEPIVKEDIDKYTTNNEVVNSIDDVKSEIVKEDKRLDSVVDNAVYATSFTRSLTPSQAPSIPNVFSGFIYKQGHLFKKMQYRYVVLANGMQNVNVYYVIMYLYYSALCVYTFYVIYPCLYMYVY